MAAAYNSVPIGIGVAGKGYVKSLLEADHARHRIHRRRVHAYLAVPIDRHEAERRIDDVIHDLQIESVALADGIPVSHASAAQRIHADPNLALADCLQIDHRGQIAHVGIEVLMVMYSGGAPSTFKRYSRHTARAVGNEVVGVSFYPFGDVSVRGSAVGRIVFKAAEPRRVMRWCDDDAVRESTLATTIVGENRVRDYRGGSVTIISIDHHVDAIRRQYLQRAGKSALRNRVRTDADVERPVNALLLAIKANRLRDCEDVRFVERVIERGAAMPGSSKHDSLGGHGWIRSPGVICGHQAGHVDQQRRFGRLACKWRNCHLFFLCVEIKSEFRILISPCLRRRAASLPFPALDSG